MKRYLSILVLALACGSDFAQSAKPTPSPTPANRSPQQPITQRQASSFELSEYGVEFVAEPRLIIMMCALEAAGFESRQGRTPSVFSNQVRQELAGLEPDLRNRLHTFYERNKLPSPATPADQAARYVSLALALGPPPALEAPERSDDLPSGLLEVLDFAPLVQEFYRRSGIDERLISYTRSYQAEGDRLRTSAAEMVRAVLSYLHTRPVTVAAERVLVKSPAASKKKNAPKAYSFKEHERHFLIVPDLLGVPGVINFRIIGDDYFAIIPPGTNPASSELRRAYLQYVIDPLTVRFNKEIAARRDQIKAILNEREKAGTSVTPDVFLVVTRSLVSAADARFQELRRLDTLAIQTRSRLASAKDETSRTAIVKETQTAISAIHDDTTDRLAQDYEGGAVLAFYFADQLKGIENSGFDIANFFVDMIASLDSAREIRRPAEYAEARRRAVAARQARMAVANAEALTTDSDDKSVKAAAFVNKLAEIEEILRLKDYNGAELRLKELFKDYPGEPRVFFALAQTASLAAADATDEEVQSERLKRALVNYRLALQASSPDTDRALLSRAHEALGRIHAFLDNPAEASKEFDEAIKIGKVQGGAYEEAIEGKKKLDRQVSTTPE